MVENLSRHYTTYSYDYITDKYYACDRTYDSAVKRFTTRDAVKGDIRNASTLNAYIYVLNNPLKYIDPMGQSPISAIGDWASSVGNTVGNALGTVKNTVGSVMNSIGNAFKGAAAVSYTHLKISKTTDKNGRSVSYTYDSMGNIISSNNDDGSNISYSYDANGNLLKVKDERGF